MIDLRWQLALGAQPVKGGTFLDVTDRALMGSEEKWTVRAADTGATGTLALKGQVSIGGKLYLLVRDHGEASSLVVVRQMSDGRLCAMDPDRFSSLTNALRMYLEAHPNIE